MDPKQTPPVGVNSDNIGSSVTGRSLFSSPTNRFRDTTPKGDIIIPPSTSAPSPRGSKKPLVIALVVVLLVAIVGIVAFVIMGGGGNGGKLFGSGSDKSEFSSTSDFNTYANYIISGEANTARLTEELRNEYEAEDSVKNYAIIDAFYDGNADFMNAAKQYFDTFYTTYQSEADKPANLTSLVDSYKQSLDFLFQNFETGSFSDEELLSLYLSGADTEAAINEKYAPYVALENSSTAKEYAETEAEYDRALIRRYVIYNGAGCIVDGAVNDECANLQAYPEDSNSDYVLSLANSGYGIITSSLSTVVQNCWTIDDELYGSEGEASDSSESEETLENDITLEGETVIPETNTEESGAEIVEPAEEENTSGETINEQAEETYEAEN